MNRRLAIAVEEPFGSAERVAEHFGQCSKFMIVEFNANKEIIKKEEYFNPLAGNHGGSCQLPGYIQQFNVNTIIAGGMGRKAVSNFRQFGIEVITAPGLMTDEALNRYLLGELSGYEECAGHGHENGHNCR